MEKLNKFNTQIPQRNVNHTFFSSIYPIVSTLATLFSPEHILGITNMDNLRVTNPGTHRELSCLDTERRIEVDRSDSKRQVPGPQAVGPLSCPGLPL